MPELRLSTLDGEPIRLSRFDGEPMVVNLWATWCGPCRYETPYLQSVYETYQDRGLRMVAISVDTRSLLDRARAFLDSHGVEYERLHDPEMEVMNRLYALGLPATFVIDRDGRFRFIRYGPVFEGDSEFEGAIESVLE